MWHKSSTHSTHKITQRSVSHNVEDITIDINNTKHFWINIRTVFQWVRIHIDKMFFGSQAG